MNKRTQDGIFITVWEKYIFSVEYQHAKKQSRKACSDFPLMRTHVILLFRYASAWKQGLYISKDGVRARGWDLVATAEQAHGKCRICSLEVSGQVLKAFITSILYTHTRR